jgi:3-dehydroquinate synthase
MKTIEIKTFNTLSKVLIGEKLENLKNYIPQKNVIIITDTNVLHHYYEHLNQYPIVEIGLGENNKTFETLQYIFSKFVEFEVDRSWVVVGVGGGIVCDVAGFAASVYMRGLSFGFVSTTLLSQVDASVGGKNGVNFEGYKNMIGVFNQPDFVVCDPGMLVTLDRPELIAGFAEVIKAGAIRKPELFAFLEKNIDRALDLDPQVMEEIVYESVLMKAQVVENDEREKGERRVLNFGHTFAHAFEKIGSMLHGEAVSIGMVIASRLSEKLGKLNHSDVARIKNLLTKTGLPVECDFDMKLVLHAMKKDKKREGEQINLILLNNIGHAVIYKTDINQLEELINDLC